VAGEVGGFRKFSASGNSGRPEDDDSGCWFELKLHLSGAVRGPAQPVCTRTLSDRSTNPIHRMCTWYDVTSERRPQASRQFPSPERGGYDYSLSGSRTGPTTDPRTPRRSCASSRPPRTSRPGRRSRAFIQDAGRRFAAIPHSRPGHADLAARGTCPADPRRAPTSCEGSAMAERLVGIDVALREHRITVLDRDGEAGSLSPRRGTGSCDGCSSSCSSCCWSSSEVMGCRMPRSYGMARPLCGR
jgi:hypothetical protein